MPEIEKSWWTVPIDKQYKEDKKITKEDVEALRSWIEKQPHLPVLPDDLLGIFLVCCGYSIEAAKRVIDLNYTLRTRNPRLFVDRSLDNYDVKSMTDFLNLGLAPFKKGQPAVLLISLRQMELSQFNFEGLVKLAVILQDISNLMLGPVPEGYVYLFDVKNLTMGQVLKINLALCAQVLKYSQEACCCKIAGIHVMHSGPVLEALLNLVKPWIQPEIWKMITPHEKTTGLTQYLNPEQIPLEYDGGKGPSVVDMHREFIENIEKYTDYFKMEEKWRVAEEKRPAESKSVLDVGGIQGSFRKLELD